MSRKITIELDKHDAIRLGNIVSGNLKTDPAAVSQDARILDAIDKAARDPGLELFRALHLYKAIGNHSHDNYVFIRCNGNLFVAKRVRQSTVYPSREGQGGPFVYTESRADPVNYSVESPIEATIIED